MASDLSRAVARGELRLCDQPIVDLGDGTVVAVEALARWQHPERGAIDPPEFIPLAEETGFILELWQWSIEEACRRAPAWHALRPKGPPLLMSVNVSPSHFQQPDLADQLARVLERTGLDPTLLRVEITESVLMEDAPATVKALRALKRLGVQLAIDDFGTGYSSLNYLRRFPVDTIKIDRSFVHDLATDRVTVAIVQAICTLARALGKQTVVEGVETAGQLAAVRALSVDQAQGYHFAKPLGDDEVPAVLAVGAFAPLLGGAPGQA